MKALGLGWRGLAFRDIEVGRDAARKAARLFSWQGARSGALAESALGGGLDHARQGHRRRRRRARDVPERPQGLTRPLRRTLGLHCALDERRDPTTRAPSTCRRTDFPMKADLARREPQQLAAWEACGSRRSAARRRPDVRASSSTTGRRTRTATSTSGTRSTRSSRTSSCAAAP